MEGLGLDIHRLVGVIPVVGVDMGDVNECIVLLHAGLSWDNVFIPLDTIIYSMYSFCKVKDNGRLHGFMIDQQATEIQ
jgi:hypothetical protein